MAAPDPRAGFLVMLNQRHRLGVMHDYEIVIEKSTDAIFIDDLLVNFLLDAREIDLCALQRVVHLFRD